MLVDTDVLIWHLRGRVSATQALNALGSFEVSVVTWMELVQGMRNGAELAAVKRSFELRGVASRALAPEISNRAVALMEGLALSHGLQMADALIAATAVEHGTALLTGNVKHFSAVPGLSLQPFLVG